MKVWTESAVEMSSTRRPWTRPHHFWCAPYRKVLRVLSTVAMCRYSRWLPSDSASDSWPLSSSLLRPARSFFLRTEPRARRSKQARIMWARSCWSRWKFSLWDMGLLVFGLYWEARLRISGSLTSWAAWGVCSLLPSHLSTSRWSLCLCPQETQTFTALCTHGRQLSLPETEVITFRYVSPLISYLNLQFVLCRIFIVGSLTWIRRAGGWKTSLGWFIRACLQKWI